jgi:hypothetical protein
VKADELKKFWNEAKLYAEKYGRAEVHLRTVGKLHRVEVVTEICHQESHSAQNYWKSSHFDDALARVIRKRFAELSHEALALLRKQYEDALLDEKAKLLERLAEIQAIEAGNEAL